MEAGQQQAGGQALESIQAILAQIDAARELQEGARDRILNLTLRIQETEGRDSVLVRMNRVADACSASEAVSVALCRVCQHLHGLPSAGRWSWRQRYTAASGIRRLNSAWRRQTDLVSHLMDNVEATMAESGVAAVSQQRLKRILEACGFVDLAGQRLTRARRAVLYRLESGEDDLVARFDLDQPLGAGIAPDGPALDQKRVDALMGS